MNNIFNLFETERSEEFQFHPIECNIDEMLECFEKYCNNSDPPSINFDNHNEEDQKLYSRSNNIEFHSRVIDDKSIPTLIEITANNKPVAFEPTLDRCEELKNSSSEKSLASDQHMSQCKRSRDFSSASKTGVIHKQKWRWSKQEDIKLFRVIKDLSLKLNFDFSKTKLERGKVCKQHRKLFKELKIKAEWKGTLVELKDRIRKITSATKFTARDIRVLKRYLTKEAKGEISMDQVHEQFPGKTLEQVFEFKNSLEL